MDQKKIFHLNIGLDSLKRSMDTLKKSLDTLKQFMDTLKLKFQIV